jgi:hypothetical protein
MVPNVPLLEPSSVIDIEPFEVTALLFAALAINLALALAIAFALALAPRTLDSCTACADNALVLLPAPPPTLMASIAAPFISAALGPSRRPRLAFAYTSSLIVRALTDATTTGRHYEAPSECMRCNERGWRW